MPKQKIDDLKKEIGYMKISPRCKNCRYYMETKDKKKLRHYPYTTFVIRKKCALFNFATKPNAYCNKWEIQK